MLFYSNNLCFAEGNFLSMDRSFFIRLTIAVHKVIDAFTGGEELKNQIKNLADEVLSNLVSFDEEDSGKALEISKKIENLENRFEEAIGRNRIDPRNFWVLKKEYGKIRDSLRKNAVMPEAGLALFGHNGFPFSAAETEASVPAGSSENKTVNGNEHEFSERQQKIVETLKGNEEVQVGDLMKIFPDINRRTILRDLDNLMRLGLVERNGGGRVATYKALRK